MGFGRCKTGFLRIVWGVFDIFIVISFVIVLFYCEDVKVLGGCVIYLRVYSWKVLEVKY